MKPLHSLLTGNKPKSQTLTSALASFNATKEALANASLFSGQPPTVDFAAMATSQATDSQTRSLQSSPASTLVVEPVTLSNSNDPLYCDVSTGNQRPLVPLTWRRTVFDSLHGLSHPGIRATQKLLTARFVWPGINSDRRRSPDPLTLMAVNNTHIRTYGKRSLTLNLQVRHSLPWIFIIADVQKPILGAEFLSSDPTPGTSLRSLSKDPANPYLSLLSEFFTTSNLNPLPDPSNFSFLN